MERPLSITRDAFGRDLRSPTRRSGTEAARENITGSDSHTAEQLPGNNVRRGGVSRWMRFLLFFGAVLALCWFGYLYREIAFTAGIDNARPADAIAVFGAAEYGGRPSPVFHARLDKALSLYQKGLAPLIITLGGGSAKDSGNTEGAAGRDYLLANGVPGDHILAETTSVDTEQQVDDLAVLAVEHNLRNMDVVSDGTHLYRIALLCRRAGLIVYTSPRAPLGHIDDLDRVQRVLHELLSTTSVALNLHGSAVHRWLQSS